MEKNKNQLSWFHTRKGIKFRRIIKKKGIKFPFDLKKGIFNINALK
jgi:hypothetical protein